MLLRDPGRMPCRTLPRSVTPAFQYLSNDSGFLSPENQERTLPPVFLARPNKTACLTALHVNDPAEGCHASVNETEAHVSLAGVYQGDKIGIWIRFARQQVVQGRLEPDDTDVPKQEHKGRREVEHRQDS